MAKWSTIFVMASFSLAGCSTQLNTGGGCPPLVEYSAQTQRRAADELERLPKGSAMAQMIVDYKKTRDACRITQ